MSLIEMHLQLPMRHATFGLQHGVTPAIRVVGHVYEKTCGIEGKMALLAYVKCSSSALRHTLRFVAQLSTDADLSGETNDRATDVGVLQELQHILLL